MKLAHFSVRTDDLEASCAFYERVLGFRRGYRPDFPFPGAWLYRGGDEADFGVVHLIGIAADSAGELQKYLGDGGASGGTGAIDHIAFLVSDLPAVRGRIEAEGLASRARTVPALGLHQLFIEDPSGVTIELNFPAAEAAGDSIKGAGPDEAGA